MGILNRARQPARQPAGPFQINLNSPQANGLLLWVPLTRWSAHRDLSPYRYQPALVNGPKFETVGDGIALRLTAASDQFVHIPTITPLSGLAGTSALTVVAWVRFATTATDQQILSRDDASAGRQFTLDMSAATIRWYVNGGSAFIIYGGSIVPNTTYHVAGVLDGTGGYLYINGALAASQLGAFTLPVASGWVQIGRRTYAGSENPLDGWLTDARIYRRGLQANQIAALYRARTRWDLYRVSTGPRLFIPGSATVRTSQLIAEVAARGATGQQLSQLVVEVAGNATPPPTTTQRISQLVAELGEAMGTARGQRISQLALELAWAPPLPDGVYVDGIEHDPLLATFEIQKSLNEIETMKADFDSHVLPYFRPPLDVPIEYREGGRRLFAGYVMGTGESAYWADALATDSMAVRVDASSYAVVASRRYVNESFAAGATLKQYAARLVPYFPSVVTFDTTMPDGPVLDARDWTNRLLSDALAELVTAAANAGDPFFWRISPDGVFGFHRLGSLSAPFDIIDGDPRLVGDVEVEERRTNSYANRVIVTLPPSANVRSSESFHAADGVTQANGLIAFFAQYATRASAIDEVNGWPNELYFDGTAMGPIIWSPNALTLGTGGTQAWGWDWANHCLVFDPTVAGGAFPTTEQIDITYAVDAVIAEDVAEQTIHGVWEYRTDYSQPISIAAAQALAAGLLAARVVTPATIRYRTFQSGIEPGQVQHFTSIKRNIDTDVLITEVDIRYYSPSAPVGAGDPLIREIVATGRASDSAAIPKGRWQDVLKQWSGLAT